MRLGREQDPALFAFAAVLALAGVQQPGLPSPALCAEQAERERGTWRARLEG